jgi:hypothetical protein
MQISSLIQSLLDLSCTITQPLQALPMLGGESMEKDRGYLEPCESVTESYKGGRQPVCVRP